MHISEGVLSLPMLLSGGAITVVGTTLGLKKTDGDHLMSVALLSAAFFVATFIHVPIVPSNAHLLLSGLLGLVLGWGAFPALVTALVLQAVLFQYGGVAVLGVNAATMGLPAVGVYYACRPFIRRGEAARSVAAFLGGMTAVLGSAVLTAAALALTDEGFYTPAKVLLLAHAPLSVVEGFISVFVVNFVAKVQPDILGLEPVVKTPVQEAG